MADHSRLGRGLASLIGDVGEETSIPEQGRRPRRAPVENLKPNPRNPRRTYTETELTGLADSIRERGIIQPIVVRSARDSDDMYEIIAGERRWRAAQRAGLREIPAIVRETSDREAFEIALIENLQRADLNAIEEAEAYEVLVREHALTQEKVAERVGKERSTVANALRLLKLPAPVRESVRDGQLEMGHARALLSLEDADAIQKAAQRAIRDALSVRATEALVRQLLGGGKRPQKGNGASESPAVRDLVNRLQRRLGARCRLVPKSQVAGRIEVDYTSLEELDGILSKIGV